MSDDKIAEIRERYAGYSLNSGNAGKANEDRGWLLAEVDRRGAEIERLRAALRWYADPRNHFPVERRSPGDPDPAVVFVEEPPIMDDCGRRARAALEGEA